MINEFKKGETRQSGVVYDGSFEQIKLLHAMDPVKAGELAISVIELTLTGNISSDDPMMPMFLATVEKVVKKDKQKYESKVAATESKKLERLTRIADLYNSGMSQKEIAEALGKTPSTISGDMSTIRAEYSYLLNDSKKFEKFGKFGADTGTDNDTENDNDTVTDNVTDTYNDNVAKPMLAKEKKSLIDGLI